jgi:PAS domain S-box-containing protein
MRVLFDQGRREVSMPQNLNGHSAEARSEESLDGFLQGIAWPPAPALLVDGQLAPVGRLLGSLFEALGPLLSASIFCIDRLKGRVIYTSQHLLASMGYEPWQIRSISLADLVEMVHPRDRHLVAQFEESLSGADPVEVAKHEVRLRTAGGRWRWIETVERVMTRSEDGRAHLTIGVARDVTDRRKLRRALSAASKELLESEENERRRIARDLHDSTGQLLVAASLMLAEAEYRGGDAHASIRRARNAISAAQKDIRTLSYLLHPPQLASQGLPATLRSFAEGFGRRSGLDIQVEIEGEPGPLSPAAELALFRVAQEALMNVYKHAHAQTARVRLRYGAQAAELEIEDDGVGLQASAADLSEEAPEEPAENGSEHTATNGAGGRPETVRPGVGLSSMQARMAQLGGRLTLSDRGKGLRVHALLPLNGA